MGTSVSKASPLAPTFERMATWDLKASRRLLQTYKDKDMDFGLDAQGLADLVGGDKNWAESIIDAFRSPTGIINALAFVCGACLVSSGPALEKAGMIFDALDFDGTEQISMDEMTIAFLCCARGFCVMAGLGAVPSDEELESITLQAYRDLNKGSTQSISKAEFTKWILAYAGGTGAAPTREVTLQNALEQFRMVPPTRPVDEYENNNTISSEVGDEAQVDQLHDEDVHVDRFHANEPPQQEADENGAEFIPDQEHENVKKSLAYSERIEPTFVATDIDQHEIFDVSGHSTEQAEPENSTLGVGDNDQGEEQAQTDDLVDRVDEVHTEVNLGIEQEQQIANESHDPDVDEPLANYLHDHSTSSDVHTNELSTKASREAETDDVDLQGDVNDNRNIESEDTEAVVASEKLEMEDLPPGPIPTVELETDDLEYDQDEFAQETPRSNDVADDGPSGENADIHPLENTEQALQPAHGPNDPSTEEAEPTTNTGENEMTSAQEIAENGANMDETSPPVVILDQESTSENAEANEEAFGDAVASAVPAVASPRTYSNAFDNQDPRFGGSSVHPPVEPQELNDDGIVTAVDLSDANASRVASSNDPVE